MTRLKSEFRVRNILPNGVSFDCFLKSQWNLHPIFFLIYRTIGALYVFGWLAYILGLAISNPNHSNTGVGVGENNGTGRRIFSVPGSNATYRLHFVLAYFTIWSYSLLSAHLVFAWLMVVVWALLNRSISNLRNRAAPFAGASFNKARDTVAEGVSAVALNESTNSSSVLAKVVPLRWYMKVSWIMFNISCNAGLIVTSVYFTLLWPYVVQRNGGSISLIDLHIHGLNSVFIAAELCFTALPVRILHFVYPACFGLLYGAWSLIFWAMDKKNNGLYPRILDWEYFPVNSAIVLSSIALVGIPVVQLFMYLVYRLRVFIAGKIS